MGKETSWGRHAPDPGRQTKPKPTSASIGDGSIKGEFEFYLVNLGEDAATTFEEKLALRRQGDCPRVAMEQPDAQAVLEPRYGLSDSRGRNAQAPPGVGEASRFGGPDENA